METLSRLKSKPLRLLQITDCHLGSEPGETLLGLDTAKSLDDVLRQIPASEKPFDMIVATGDISNDGGVRSYENFVAAIREKFPRVPLAWLEGNHDDPLSMREVSCERPLEKLASLGDWQMVMLNSRVPFEDRGELSEAEIEYLDSVLAANPEKPTLIFLHHQLVPVGSAWIDQYIVSNAADFFTCIDKYDNVKGIAWGHVHQEFNGERNGVKLHASPSTCVQFVPNQDSFAVDQAMPGYRVYNLFADGTFTSTVGRVAQQTYSIDYASAGY